MSIWVVLMLGPVAAVLAGAAIIKGFSLLGQLDTDRFMSLISVSEWAATVVLGLAALGVIAAVVLIWQVSPWLATFLLVVIAANGSLAWTVMRRRGPVESDRD